jgi:hypothetical protein
VASPSPHVSVTPHDGKTLVECTLCGPVAVTDTAPIPAAETHLSVFHGVTHYTFVEPTP